MILNVTEHRKELESVFGTKILAVLSRDDRLRTRLQGANFSPTEISTGMGGRNHSKTGLR